MRPTRPPTVPINAARLTISRQARPSVFETADSQIRTPRISLPCQRVAALDAEAQSPERDRFPESNREVADIEHVHVHLYDVLEKPQVRQSVTPSANSRALKQSGQTEGWRTGVST